MTCEGGGAVAFPVMTLGMHSLIELVSFAIKKTVEIRYYISVTYLVL